jgi:hypothetical protein
MGKPELLPCPFCNGTSIDPKGWLRGDGVSGPACDDCGGSAGSVAEWNARPREALIADLVGAIDLLLEYRVGSMKDGRGYIQDTDGSRVAVERLALSLAKTAEG